MLKPDSPLLWGVSNQTGEKEMIEEYENEESREITKFLKEARQKLINEGLPEDCILPVEKVVFIRDKK